MMSKYICHISPYNQEIKANEFFTIELKMIFNISRAGIKFIVFHGAYKKQIALLNLKENVIL